MGVSRGVGCVMLVELRDICQSVLPDHLLQRRSCRTRVMRPYITISHRSIVNTRVQRAVSRASQPHACEEYGEEYSHTGTHPAIADRILGTFPATSGYVRSPMQIEITFHTLLG